MRRYPSAIPGGTTLSTGTLQIELRRQTRLPLLPGAIAVYAAGAAVLSPDAYLNMLLVYINQLVALPLVLMVGAPVSAMLLRPRAPFAYMRDLFRQRGLRLLAVFAVACVGLAAFTTYKLAIPKLVPFYADPVLGDIDAWLHGGNPGEFAHAAVPAWAQYPLGYLYGPVWFLSWFGLIALVALHGDAALRRRYFWTMATAFCVLGTIAAVALSSVGPVLYERVYHVGRYVALTTMIEHSAVGDYMRQATGYLFGNFQSDGHRPGTGISAMPSMHLAVATLNAHLLSRFNRVLGALGWAYVAAILLGSVYLGWHYAIDGYVSIAAVTLIWWLAGRQGVRAAAG